MAENVLIEVLKNGTKKSKNSRLRMKIIAEFKKINSKKEKEKMVKPICSYSTNGNSCHELISPETGLYEPCAFSGLCPNYNGNSKEEREKFLENTIITLCVSMSECRRRLEKGGSNHNKKQSEIKNIKKQVQAKVNDINREIKLLR